MSAKVTWIVTAAVLGAVAAVVVDRSLRNPDPSIPDERVEPTAEDVGPSAPPPVEPGPARGLVVESLTGLGVPESAISHGVYPLRGPGRSPDETIPLVSFTCPTGQSCPAVFSLIEARARGAGYTVVGAAGGDTAGRPAYRALSIDGRPALALRGFPAGPRITVVVAGVGREPGLLEALLALDPHVTFAVAANAPHAEQVARRLQEKKREVVAQLPMEPAPPQAADGDAFLTTAMSPQDIRRETAALLARVPGAVGAANHLGSRLVASRTHMSAVLEVLKARALFYLDNRAAATSVAEATARVLGVRTAARTHFLDAVDELTARLNSIEAALVLDGYALVVAPPTPGTLLALQGWMQALQGRGIHFFRLSETVL